MSATCPQCGEPMLADTSAHACQSPTSSAGFPPRRRDVPSLIARAAPVLLVAGMVFLFVVPLAVIKILQWREAALRTQSIDNLKAIGLAFHNHHDTLKALPFNGTGPAVDGKPWTGSWAFQILPYLNQGHYFGNSNQLKQPGLAGGAWSDYAINIWLNDSSTPLPPTVYNSYNYKRTMVGVTDGTSNTIFVGHASIDLPYASTVQAGPSPQSCLIVDGGTSGTGRLSMTNVADHKNGTTGALNWGGPFPQGSLMGMGDGTVQIFPYPSDFLNFGKYLTPTGGAVVFTID